MYVGFSHQGVEQPQHTATESVFMYPAPPLWSAPPLVLDVPDDVRTVHAMELDVVTIKCNCSGSNVRIIVAAFSPLATTAVVSRVTQ